MLANEATAGLHFFFSHSLIGRKHPHAKVHNVRMYGAQSTGSGWTFPRSQRKTEFFLKTGKKSKQFAVVLISAIGMRTVCSPRSRSYCSRFCEILLNQSKRRRKSMDFSWRLCPRDVCRSLWRFDDTSLNRTNDVNYFIIRRKWMNEWMPVRVWFAEKCNDWPNVDR